MSSTTSPLLWALLAAPLVAPHFEARGATQASGLEGRERSLLRQLEGGSGDLEGLRAGSPLLPAPLDEGRSQLRDLERAHPELAEARAGDLSLSNRQLTTILLVLGIILLLVIIF